MNIAYVNRPGQDILSLNFIVPVGSKTLHDGKINCFAHLVEHLLFHGHPELSQYELMFAVEQAGGYVNAQTNETYTELYLRLPVSALVESACMFERALTEFAITREDYKVERELVRLEEYGLAAGDDFVSDRALCALQGACRAGRIPGFDKIKEIYKEYYNCFTCLVIGDVPQRYRDELEARGFTPSQEPPALYKSSLMLPPSKDAYTAAGQCEDGVCHTFIKRCDPSTGALELRLLRYLYTEGISSILYDKLVADSGLCYCVNFRGYLEGEKLLRIWFVTSDRSSEADKLAASCFEREFVEGLSDEVLMRAVRMAATSLKIKYESGAAILNDCVESFLFGEGSVQGEQDAQRLFSLSAAQARSIVLKALFG